MKSVIKSFPKKEIRNYENLCLAMLEDFKSINLNCLLLKIEQNSFDLRMYHDLVLTLKILAEPGLIQDLEYYKMYVNMVHDKIYLLAETFKSLEKENSEIVKTILVKYIYAHKDLIINSSF